LYLDVETTGLDPKVAHIIEVGAVVFNGEVEVDSFSTLANPGGEALRQASPGAMSVNRITAEMLAGAPSLEDAAKALLVFLERHPEAVFHAYNNKFDAGFLAQAQWNVPSARWGECVMLAAKKIMKMAWWPRLGQAAQFFGVAYVDAHRALGDARTAALVHKEIVSRREEDTSEAHYLLDSGY
jgi:DNA polymerase III epsilon subunit-like protein